MPTEDEDRHRPQPIPSDSTWNPAPAAAKPDRARYEDSRCAELDRIRLIDIRRRQLLVHAMEGYLLGCVGDQYRQPNRPSAGEEDLMVRTFGPPWVKHPVTLSRSRLNDLRPPGAAKVPTQGSATSVVELAMDVAVGESGVSAQKYGLTPREVT
jgi:hypothetical protein